MNFKKALSLLVCIVMVLSSVQGIVIFADSEETTILAASDFQATSGNSGGMSNVLNILKAIKADGITSADAMFFCGDYDIDTYGDLSSTKDGVKFLKLATQGFVEPDDMVLVQGNHDASSDASSGLSPFGANDPKNGKYGVFVIHNDDYMWYNNDSDRIKRTAQRLIDYLNEKLAQNYDKPIFVLSHLPLHYSMRTIVDGDAKYASYIFNALNEAAEKGLNIVYMFGHDHSNGWDDYLGGAAVCLKKGDEILIAKNSTSTKEYHKLNFTYMNAGYVGYYNNHNGADDALTMSVIKIRDGELTITRYDKNGVHDVKSKGVTNAYKNEKGYSPNESVYPSPVNVTLTNVTNPEPIKDLMEITFFGMRFHKVDDLSMLKDGGKYVLVRNASPDYIMVPKVAIKSDDSGSKRTGYNIVKSSDFGDSAAFGNFARYSWTFKKQGDGWLIGDGEGWMKLTNSTDQKIKATLEAQGDVMKISGSSGNYVIETGAYSLNYNARGLINAYTSDPAKFYIYEYVGYSLEVKNGTATVDGAAAEYADVGKTVVVEAGETPSGMEFDKWEIIKGEISIEDLKSDVSPKIISFTMPESGVALRAVYKVREVITDDVPTTPAHTPEQTETPSTEDTPEVTGDDGEFTVVIIVIAVSAVVFGCIAYFVVKKIKNKK